jgi:translation initiation factor 6 (eIF-6)
MPPFGVTKSDHKPVDGFGGEIVHKLVPHLSTEGTMYWITARGAFFNSGASEKIADLKKQGLLVAACIEIAPGAIPETMTEGAGSPLTNKGFLWEPTLKSLIAPQRVS